MDIPSWVVEGTKVECIDASVAESARGWVALFGIIIPSLRVKYTIRDVSITAEGGYFCLSEIVNPEVPNGGGLAEPMFGWEAFRPLTDKYVEQDRETFAPLLDTKSDAVPVREIEVVE